ncbi:MAG: hypothetical protein N2749_07180 [Clostridia bacterium]|nr:hypothetical protein [Clostridia bacterium]
MNSKVKRTVMFFKINFTSLISLSDNYMYELFNKIDNTGIIYGVEKIDDKPSKILSVLEMDKNSVFGIVGKNEDVFLRAQRVEFDGINISYPDISEYKNYAFISYFYIDFKLKIGCYLSNTYNISVDHIIRDTIQVFDQNLNVNINYLADSEENIDNVKKAIKKIKKIKINLSNSIIENEYGSFASSLPILNSSLQITVKNKYRDATPEYNPKTIIDQLEEMNSNDKKIIIDYIGEDNISSAFNLNRNLLSKKILVDLNDSEVYNKDSIKYYLKQSLTKINVK